MKPVSEFKGYSAFFDENDDTVSFVSGRLSSVFGADEASDRMAAPAETERKSELQSLLLMASLMLGGREAASGA